MEEFDTIFIVIVLVLLVIIYKVGTKWEKAKEENNTKTTLLNTYVNTEAIMKEKGIVNSKNFTYFFEPDMPLARIIIDDVHKQVIVFKIAEGGWIKFPYSTYRYCQFQYNQSSGSLAAGAVKGGILAGGAGAIVGAMAAKNAVYISDMRLVIFLDDFNHPEVSVPLSFQGRGDYKQAEIFSTNVENALEYIERHGCIN